MTRSFTVRLTGIWLFIFVGYLPIAAQSKIEIVLIGTIHNITDSQSNNWNYLNRFLENYKPDMICGEYWIPTDTVSLLNVKGKNYFQTLDSLKAVWRINPAFVKKQISKLLSEISRKDDWKLRIELYQLYTVTADIGNAEYHAWCANAIIAGLPLPDQEKIKANEPLYSRIETLVLRRKVNEYGNVVFPFAFRYGIEYIFPVDDRNCSDSFSIAYQEWYAELKETLYYERWKKFYAYFNETESAVLKTGNALEFVNSVPWQLISDYGQTDLLIDSKNQWYNKWVKFWNARNYQVASNILNSLKERKVKRVVVFMGYMHIPKIKKYLKNIKGITLKTISDFE